MITIILIIALVVSIMFNIAMFTTMVGEIIVTVEEGEPEIHVKVKNIEKITTVPNKTFAVFRVIKPRKYYKSYNERR